MPKFHIWTIGCQMNKAESVQISQLICKHGYVLTTQLNDADVVVLNTCVVRQSAEDKVRGTLGYLKGIKNYKSDLRILVTGCFVDSNLDVLQAQFPQVDLFFKPGEYSDLLEWLRNRPNSNHEWTVIKSPVWTEGIVAYVPIIQGCNNFCSYCIVPYRRGQEKSRPLDEVVNEVRQLAQQKTKEIILLGQNVNSYGHDLCTKTSLNELLHSLNNLNDLYRIRFLTNHPKDMNSELIQGIAYLEKVCKHISLPVQSGDDTILERMKRGYTVEHYRDLVHFIRKSIPDVTLSTDVIVGFPGETEDQFAGTISLLEEIRFDVVHVAAYSPRPETLADKHYVDNISDEVKKNRLRKVEAIYESIAGEINSNLLGKIVEVLVEDIKDGKWYGRTRSDKLVFFESEAKCIGKLLNIKITKSSPWALQGCISEDDLNGQRKDLEYVNLS